MNSRVPALRRTLGRARLSLSNLPTSLDRMPRLARFLGAPEHTLYVKRDDCLSFAAGGNKVRKMEFLAADALRAHADVLVTGGGAQSNHARVVAAVASRLGMESVLLLTGTGNASSGTGNHLLYEILGATIESVPTEDDRAADLAVEAACARLASLGHRPYGIPIGGSTALGSLGYVVAASEIRAQLRGPLIAMVATGSMGTHAGLAVGFGDFESVLGVRVGGRPDLEGQLRAKAEECAHLAGLPVPRGTPRIVHDQIGAGYGAPTPQAAEAIRLAARLEGLFLDPVYTGKAMAALIAAYRARAFPPDTSVVFVHTGGFPGLFAENHRDWLLSQPRPERVEWDQRTA